MNIDFLLYTLKLDITHQMLEYF